MLRKYFILWIMHLCYFTLLGQGWGLQWLQKDQIFLGRNPAIPFSAKYNIGLPSGNGGIQNESGLFFPNSRTSSVTDLEIKWKQLKPDKKKFTDVDWGVRSIYFGKKYDRFQWAIGHSIKGFGNLFYDKNVTGLLLFGNFGLVDKLPEAKSGPLSLQTGIHSSIYQSFSFETGYKINNSQSVGLELNILSGFYNIKSDITKLDIDIRSPFEIKLDEDWSLHSADLLQTFQIDSIRVHRVINALSRHAGLGAHLGWHHDGEKLKLSAQLRDLGFIRWQGKKFSRTGKTVYDGVQVNDFLQINNQSFNTIRDTLEALANVNESENTYTTTLSAQWMADAQYDLDAHWTLGSAIRYVRFKDRNLFNISAAAIFKPSSFLNIGGQVSYAHSDFRVGLFGSIKVAIVNLYMSIDHLQAILKPDQINKFYAQAGMSVLWGNVK